MAAAKTLGLLVITLSLVGCEPVLSLHPLFDPSEQIAEPALEGTWVEDEGDLRLALRPSGQNAYELATVDEDKREHHLKAQVARLGKYLFLDASPDERNIEALQIPAHAFFKVRIEADALELAYLDDDWMRGMVRERKLTIAHERLGDDILLTASTKDLQTLALKYAGDPDAFSPTRFHRQK